MQTATLALGPFLCALAVAAGAFGAHGLAERLDAHALELWETGARYLMYAGLGMTLLGLAARQAPRPGYDWASICLLVGSVIFSGTVAAIALAVRGRSPGGRAIGSYGTHARHEEESMRCHRRRRVTQQAYRNPLSPFGLRRQGAIGGVAAPPRCYGIACVAPPGFWPHGARNATATTSTTSCWRLIMILKELRR